MPFVSLLHQLMCPNDQFHLIHFFELFHCSTAKQPTCSSRILTPTINIFFRVRPHQITKGPRRRYLDISFQSAYRIYGGSFRRKTSMYAKDLSFDDCCKREIVKGIVEVVPNIMIAIFFTDFVIESINVGDIARFVIASQKNYHFGILQLVEEEQKNRFNGIEASIHVISKEDISFRRNRPSFSKQLQQIPKLAVYISADGYWSLDWLHIRLLEQQSLDPAAQKFDSLFWDNLALQDGFDEGIYVHAIIQA